MRVHTSNEDWNLKMQARGTTSLCGVRAHAFALPGEILEHFGWYHRTSTDLLSQFEC
jgi:hypothetical protein